MTTVLRADTQAVNRPSWIISDDDIAATAADYVALGHWNRAIQVGVGPVRAYYSGSPELAETVNVVRLRGDGTVAVARAPIRQLMTMSAKIAAGGGAP